MYITSVYLQIKVIEVSMSNLLQHDSKMLKVRKATSTDIPFLAQTSYESSLPPQNHSPWDDILEGTGTSAIEFLEAVLKASASAWGNVEDFRILEEDNKPVAAAAVYQPNDSDYRYIDLSRFNNVSKLLGWSDETIALFHLNYEETFGKEPRNIVFKPQAPWIIETVAVIPEARGRGLGKALVKVLLEEGREKGHSHAGIMIINGNELARRTYESLGFKHYISFGAEYFDNGFSGLTKFRLRLN
jgi:GNAT superfamily N-acetyltransferase